MTFKIPGAFKRFFTEFFRSRSNYEQLPKLQRLENKNKKIEPSSSDTKPEHQGLKLATFQLTPTITLLIFRVSNNSAYLNLARPNSDLMECRSKKQTVRDESYTAVKSRRKKSPKRVGEQALRIGG
ncbi:uncharacterized protein LOC125225165 [Leguminivora glycinivorella]|uniref:uncharacterized protein LOC125225165 n=1 Tax=Leguminivora glycinivorella TaxID=1035111 RepID=UPI00200BEC8E|nr:uncharacterized protein LOC125225165 [Leguminivora glycinivorella]